MDRFLPFLTHYYFSDVGDKNVLKSYIRRRYYIFQDLISKAEGGDKKCHRRLGSEFNLRSDRLPPRSSSGSSRLANALDHRGAVKACVRSSKIRFFGCNFKNN